MQIQIVKSPLKIGQVVYSMEVESESILEDLKDEEYANYPIETWAVPYVAVSEKHVVMWDNVKENEKHIYAHTLDHVPFYETPLDAINAMIESDIKWADGLHERANQLSELLIKQRKRYSVR